MNHKLLQSITSIIGALGMSCIWFLKLTNYYLVAVLFLVAIIILWLNQYYIITLLEKHPETDEEKNKFKLLNRVLRISAMSIFILWILFYILWPHILKP